MSALPSTAPSGSASPPRSKLSVSLLPQEVVETPSEAGSRGRAVSGGGVTSAVGASCPVPGAGTAKSGRGSGTTGGSPDSSRAPSLEHPLRVGGGGVTRGKPPRALRYLLLLGGALRGEAAVWVGHFPLRGSPEGLPLRKWWGRELERPPHPAEPFPGTHQLQPPSAFAGVGAPRIRSVMRATSSRVRATSDPAFGG
ncbi:hypothetical protein GUJ93_ZPchr0009g397 [Zizania palustris]|uniref:Uncharacterized protein n=1 Tax=Zizania palustris TaxID=103762 RepID=A0A8J5R848_ZIZPA|nr:hypothetical protein GUJ93_ZPchr0009g397 [Zizania palustris]